MPKGQSAWVNHLKRRRRAMKQYVCGFLFDTEKKYVVLIKKLKGPPNNIGRLNGIGGTIEPGEFWCEAMSREFHEEAGARIDPAAWTRLCGLLGSNDGGWYVTFCYATVPGDIINSVRTMEEEPVLILPVDRLAGLPVVDNLRWLIPMAFDPYKPHGDLVNAL